MSKLKKKTAAALQIAHCRCCSLVLFLMAIYPPLRPTKIGMTLIGVSAFLLCGCTIVPIGLMGSVMQLVRCVRHRRQKGAPPPAGLVVWAIAGPVVCAVLWMMAVVIFVETTGGV